MPKGVERLVAKGGENLNENETQVNAHLLAILVLRRRQLLNGLVVISYKTGTLLALLPSGVLWFYV
jgi:hypothetical protein